MKLEEPKFKVGDIIKPCKGKKTSRSYRIDRIIKAEVTAIASSENVLFRTEYTNYTIYGTKSRLIRLKILEGKITENWNYRGMNPVDHCVYQDSFELYKPNLDNINIFF